MENSVIVIGAGIGGLSVSALLAQQGIRSTIYEKSKQVGGRTSSMIYKNHVLDNGFHIMPFYTQSAIYKILKKIGIESSLKLTKVDDIAFYSDGGFHRYPKGITDLLSLSMIPFKSRLSLLKILLPIAFTSIKDTELWDNVPLTKSTENLDAKTNAFFEAICMLAFADSAKNISLGEFARTIIRANPFRGGTSEFAYPLEGGYDQISKVLLNYVQKQKCSVHLESTIKKIIVRDQQVVGIIDSNQKFIESNCVIISYPAYHAINQLFEKDVFNRNFVNKINKLNETTAVVEVHFALSKKLDKRHVVFPVGNNCTAKGIFFVSNMTPKVSPKGQHLIISGTPVPPNFVKNPRKIREIVDQMKNEINNIYPEFTEALLWERPMAWSLVESVVKKPGMVWKSKMPHSVEAVSGLFFVGDSTISYGIGTDSAAHSSILCLPKILKYVKSKNSMLAYLS